MSRVPNHAVKFEFLSFKTLRELNIGLKEFVDWLLESHIHFIIAHVHQGTETFKWSMEALYAELQRLKYHAGFPTFEQLNCPMFTQDKMKYLKALPEGSTMPTYEIPLSMTMDMTETEDLIKRYVQ